MFSIFKKKPTLESLIPKGFTDFHSHLLPGIDDGSKSIEDTVDLIRILKSYGFKNFVTTPHVFETVWNNTESTIITVFEQTSTLLVDEGNPIIRSGAEYMMDSYFLKKIESEKLLCICDNYVLVEMSYLNAPIQLYDIIFEIQLAGYIPVLAHPERYNFYHRNFDEYKKLKKAGCLFQLNLLSTVNYYGEGVTKTAEKLLKDGFIDIVGSDVHHQNHVNAFKNKVVVSTLNELETAISKNLFFAQQLR